VSEAAVSEAARMKTRLHGLTPRLGGTGGGQPRRAGPPPPASAGVSRGEGGWWGWVWN